MIRVDRRQLITTAAFGLSGLLLPGGAAMAQMLSAARGFTHNVASGEPDTESVLLWTRYVGTGATARVKAEVSTTANFAKIVGGAEVVTGPWRDWTAKVTVAGLSPGRRYFYRFIGPEGAVSPIGQTKTLGADGTREARIGIFSCSNIGFGYFNAYGHAATRTDLDLWVHLGDYLYEANRGTYPDLDVALRPNEIVPANELLSLADYRMRYASYRSDPDLQALHARHPMIASPDDHETANDSWEGGAGAHSADEGPWLNRKAAAMQAYHEWLPIDETPWKTYQIGQLATFFRTETRTSARSKQFSMGGLIMGPDPEAALRAFAAGPWQDPAMTMMGTTQEHWLGKAVRQSVRSGTKWQVIGVGAPMGTAMLPLTADSWLAKDARPVWHSRFKAAAIATRAGLPSNFDNWGGYPAARKRFLSMVQSAGANVVVLSGDSHNGWAFELPGERGTAAVEFSVPGVTPPGIDEATGGSDPSRVARDLVAVNRELKWADTSQRGYMTLTLTTQAATNEFVFMETVASRSMKSAGTQRIRVKPGHAKLEMI
jgi:alkaline phosphatase D